MVAVLFRSRLVALLNGPVKSLKAGPISVDFWQEEARIVHDDLAAAADETTKSGAPWTIGHEDLGETAGDGPHDDHHVDAELAQLRELADKTPVVVVLGAFRLVERELRAIARNAGVDGVEKMPVNRLVLIMAERGVINAETLSAVKGLSTLRNLAAHDDGSGLSISPARAREYLALVDAVLFVLVRSRREQRSSEETAVASERPDVGTPPSSPSEN